MRIYVQVRPNARRTGIRQVDEGHFVVAVSAPAKEGKANLAVTKALAEHFRIAVSRIALVSGAVARDKVFEIE